MDVTPKKLSNSDTKCFICAATVNSKNRICIFKPGGKGSSDVDLQGLLSKTLDIDVNVYASSDVAICIKCYKTLIKFEKAENHVKEIKNDLKNAYKQQRVKRLPRTDDKLPEPVTKKQLVFGESTACTSFTFPLLKTPSELLTAVSPVNKSCFNDSFSLYNAFITSTPKPKKQVSTNATITVEYPSKTVNKKLSSDLEPVGKALAHGPPSRIAKAILKSNVPSLQK
jgi:hypothetical protein